MTQAVILFLQYSQSCNRLLHDLLQSSVGKHDRSTAC